MGPVYVSADTLLCLRGVVGDPAVSAGQSDVLIAQSVSPERKRLLGKIYGIDKHKASLIHRDYVGKEDCLE